MSRNTKMLIGLVVLVIIAGGAWAIFHKSSNSTSNNTNSSTYSAASNSVPNQPVQSANVIQTKTDPTLGQYLATSAGLPLYTYKLDTAGVSNCTGSCLSSWPAYTATSSVVNLPANISTIKRTDDGSIQYTYKGLPLYTFTSDSVNNVTGNGIANFQVAKP